MKKLLLFIIVLITVELVLVPGSVVVAQPCCCCKTTGGGTGNVVYGKKSQQPQQHYSGISSNHQKKIDAAQDRKIDSIAKIVGRYDRSIKELLELHYDDTVRFSLLGKTIQMDIFPHLKSLDTMFMIYDTVIKIHSECLAYLGQYTKKKNGAKAAFGNLTTSSQELLKSYGSLSNTGGGSNNNLNINNITGGNQNQRKPFTLIRTDYSVGGWIWRTAVVGWTVYTVGCLLKHPNQNVGSAVQQGWTDGSGNVPTH